MHALVSIFFFLRAHAFENHQQLQKRFRFRIRNDFRACPTTINSPTRNSQFPVGISGCIGNGLTGWIFEMRTQLYSINASLFYSLWEINENRRDSERTNFHRPLPIVSFLWAIKYDIGLHRGLQGMNGEKSHNNICFFYM